MKKFPEIDRPNLKTRRDQARKFPPFALDRSARESLVSQLTEGFREAIRIGFYRAGDVLPPVGSLAEKLGVSVIVVRGALAQLVDEGLLSARQRIGHSVRTPEKPLWRGHVLSIMDDHDLNPQICIIGERLRRTLAMKGFLFSQVTVLSNVKGPIDYSGLDVALSRPLDFAVLIFRNPDIERHLSESGVPFAVVGGKGELLTGCVGNIVMSSMNAVRSLARECEEQGISDIEIVSCPNPSGWFDLLAGVFREHCIHPRNTVVSLPHVEGVRFDVVKKAGFDFAKRQSAHGHAVLPQLYVVTDDFLAAGMLVGFMSMGVEIPRDVRFVSYSNGGFGPFFTKPVAKIEQNADDNADEIAKRIGDWLIRRKPFPNTYLQAKFIVGRTLRRR
ncbi:MAG: GntR family transcriptional regulator [Kiritimatiellae bacterium]|nr:GntR family transcriptional regulator [Kiritimatiellia bacterium]